jgi:uncharacterized protein (TIGR02246 family)
MKTMPLTAALAFCALWSICRAESTPQAADEEAIRKAVASYAAAFNQGNAKALAAMWSPEAVYTNPLSGEQVVGRSEIEKQFEGIFTQVQGAKLDVATESIQFISPSVAVEHGTATLVAPEREPLQSTYTAVYVKREDQWLLDRVTEEDVPIVRSNYDHLKELEWMIGTWVDQGEQSRIETTCRWTKNRNFMTRMFALSVRDRIEIAGMQVIGWDPAAKQIRSWVFDSDGGFGEGVWSKKDQTWHIQLTGTSPDGSSSSSVNIITYVDNDTFTWQSINRVAGGGLLPNVDEVVVVRQTALE